MTRSILSAACLALALAPAAAGAEDRTARAAATPAVAAASTAVVAHPGVLLLARGAGTAETARTASDNQPDEPEAG